MKLLFVFCSIVVLVLIQISPSFCGGGGHEKIHLKIHVPKIINKHLHTKTVYVHVHKKPEPPKKHEHHHNHEHKHSHHTPMKKPEGPKYHHHHHHHKHDGHFHHTHNIKPHHEHPNHHHHHGGHGGHGGHKGHGGHSGHGGHGGHHHHDIKPVHETPHEHHKPGPKKPIPKKPSPKKPSKKPSHGHLFSNLIHTTHEDYYHHEPEEISLNPISDPYAVKYYDQYNTAPKYPADFDYSENDSEENSEPQQEYEELQEYEETPSDETSEEYDGPVDSYGNKIIYIYHPSENYDYSRASKRVSNDPNVILIENENNRYFNSEKQIKNDFQLPESYNPSEDLNFDVYRQSITPENHFKYFDARHEKFEDGDSDDLIGYHRKIFTFRPNR